jgi:hypothetical protein
MPCDLRKLSSVLVARFPRSSLTTQGSAVRTRHRPLVKAAGQPMFMKSLLMRTYVQRVAKSNKNPTSERSLARD